MFNGLILKPGLNLCLDDGDCCGGGANELCFLLDGVLVTTGGK